MEYVKGVHVAVSVTFPVTTAPEAGYVLVVE
jgi:hypothetical protein